MSQSTKKLIKLSIVLLVLVVTFSEAVYAQREWQNWNTIQVQAAATKKINLQFNHLRAYSVTDSYSNLFNQYSLRASYELNKRWDIQSGIQFMNIVSSKKTTTRIFLRTSHTTRIIEKINWINSLHIETNSKNENRFRQRIIATTRLGLRKRLDFLNLAPSISYSLFYNIGGDSIRYYDKNEALIARQTPDGLHRSRLTVNLNSKVNDYLRISLYYMAQREFNFLAADTRKMNVYDPVRARTLRPFNDYNSIGITAQVTLDPLLKK